MNLAKETLKDAITIVKKKKMIKIAALRQLSK